MYYVYKCRVPCAVIPMVPYPLLFIVIIYLTYLRIVVYSQYHARTRCKLAVPFCVPFSFLSWLPSVTSVDRDDSFMIHAASIQTSLTRLPSLYILHVGSIPSTLVKRRRDAARFPESVIGCWSLDPSSKISRRNVGFAPRMPVGLC